MGCPGGSPVVAGNVRKCSNCDMYEAGYYMKKRHAYYTDKLYYNIGESDKWNWYEKNTNSYLPLSTAPRDIESYAFTGTSKPDSRRRLLNRFIRESLRCQTS